MMNASKTGFRIRLPKPGPGWEVESLEIGRLCSRAVSASTTLLCLGEVIGQERPLSTPEVLDQYLREGEACAGAFDGAFVLVFLDDATQRVTVITDRLNGMKCFVEETPAGIDLVSSLCFLREETRPLDRIALTSFLANGALYCNRTIFENVRSLARASIHRFHAGARESRVYWTYKFDNRHATRSRAGLRKELAALLLQAVKRRVMPGEAVYLSLSGGYDSTCILGLLSRVQPGGVKCFSYIVDEKSAASDETVATQMAAIAGFPHFTVPSFNGDIVSLIRRNAAMGECRANFCGELDAWEAIQRQATGESVFFVGDECFGWTNCRLESASDVPAALPIHKSDVLSAYPCVKLAALGDWYDRELAAMVPVEKDWHDAKDLLYLDQRLGNVIMPWRELFCGRTIPLRNPLLDKDVLDFMSHLPSRLRRGKVLYKETVRMMFPELFRVKRASTPVSDPLRAAIFKSKSALENDLRRNAGPLAEFIDLVQCASLIRDLPATKSPSLKARLTAFAKRLLKENSLAHSMKGWLKQKPLKQADPQQLLLRIMTLHEYLTPDRPRGVTCGVMGPAGLEPATKGL